MKKWKIALISHMKEGVWQEDINNLLPIND